MERWRKIKFAEGYIISSYGRLFSEWSGKCLTKKRRANGYELARLQINKKSCYFLIHRLVALSFIRNSKNKPQVNHKDGNKLNNLVQNLEWVTRTENEKHAHKLNLYKTGEAQHKAKLTKAQVKKIRDLKGQKSSVQIALLFGVSSSSIRRVLRYETWKRA